MNNKLDALLFDKNHEKEKPQLHSHNINNFITESIYNSLDLNQIQDTDVHNLEYYIMPSDNRIITKQIKPVETITDLSLKNKLFVEII